MRALRTLSSTKMIWALVSALLLAPPARAQGTNSGTISGSVVDESEQVLPGASVTAINETSQITRTAVTSETGAFRFPVLPPGTYTIRVELNGFSTFERKNNVLNPSGNLTLATIALKVGQITETIVVEAAGAPVEVENSDQYGVLTGNQLAHLQTKGRDVTSLLKLLPGVAFSEEPEALGDSFGSSLPSMGGQAAEANNYTVDGLNGNELSGTDQVAAAVSLDAIGEVKVLQNTYKAEYGRTGGANIQVSTKSGGTAYHGSAYWYGRRTNWNANSWENKRVDAERPRYHFNTYGFTLGGPFPGQGSDKKAFFFYNAEVPRVENPADLRFFSLPTERERNGDFSQSGVTIRDPLTGQPFPGNVIPQNRINRSVQNLFRLYPLPNTDPRSNAAAANFVRQETPENPRMAHLLRLDWKPSPNDTLSLTGRTFNSNQYGAEITAGPADWGFFNASYLFSDYSANLSWTKIFNPTVINELAVGVRRQGEGFQFKDGADEERVTRAVVGWTEPLLFPALNTQDTIPRLLFGGKDNGGRRAPGFEYDTRLGQTAFDWIGSVRNNLTWIRGRHTFKGGLNAERMHNNEARGGTFRGEFQFEHNANNPLSTGDDYANALLGVFNSFTQANQQRTTTNRAWLAEWYVQDSWRTTRRLALEYGVRFLWYTPYYEADGTSASFIPRLYDPAKAPKLYQPAIVNGQRVARNPLDPNEIRPAQFIGTLVPNSGDFANGNVAEGDPGVPRGFKRNQGVHYEPRIGFAYDLTGDGKTRLHGGVGIFHQSVVGGGTQGNLGSNPPIMRTVSFTNGFISELASLEGRQPIGVVELRGLQEDAKTPNNYNFTFGIEREIGWGTVVDVSYVGGLGRHQEMEVDYNRKPDGADFAPANQDPTRPGQRLPDNFLRPFQAYGRIRIHEYWGTTSYNALQVQVNRRYTKGVQLGVAYTFSKAMTLDDNNTNPAPVDRNRPASFYRNPRSNSQTHNLIVNFTLGVPRLSRAFDNRFVRTVFDGWELSGTYALVSGNWISVDQNGYNPDGTDAADRPTLVGDPVPSDRTQFEGWINAAAFARTPVGSYGNTARLLLREPGINNLDLAAFKNFHLRGDMALQLRLETYNTLNHTQVDDINNDLNFNAAGIQTNANFGRAVSARNPRRLQASVRFTF